MANRPHAWDKDKVENYLGIADFVVVERERFLETIVEAIRWRVRQEQNPVFLDIGSGDGIVSARVRRDYPSATFYLLDGSSDMLAT